MRLTRPTPRRALAILICLGLLAFGLIRIGVGGLMVGQAAGWWSLGGEMPEALADTRNFIAARETNIVGFTPLSYFSFIVFMGVTLTLGAIGQLWRKAWGLALIWAYLASHAFLFVNFATVNPKVAYLVIGIAAALFLGWANRGPPRDAPARA